MKKQSSHVCHDSEDSKVFTVKVETERYGLFADNALNSSQSHSSIVEELYSNTNSVEIEQSEQRLKAKHAGNGCQNNRKEMGESEITDKIVKLKKSQVETSIEESRQIDVKNMDKPTTTDQKRNNRNSNNRQEIDKLTFAVMTTTRLKHSVSSNSYQVDHFHSPPTSIRESDHFARIRRHSTSLTIISLWCFLFNLPFVIYVFYMGLFVENRVQVNFSPLGFTGTMGIIINVISDPLLYAWRFVRWNEIISALRNHFARD